MNIELANILTFITYDKYGVEIGGPSFPTPIYTSANSIDNVVFSNNTIWCNQNETYNYFNNKKKKSYY